MLRDLFIYYECVINDYVLELVSPCGVDSGAGEPVSGLYSPGRSPYLLQMEIMRKLVLWTADAHGIHDSLLNWSASHRMGSCGTEGPRILF